MINNERLLQTFLELVQIDSPTGEEEAVSRDVARRLSNVGLNPYIDPYFNIITNVPGTANTKPIILNAHLDTVEPGRGIKPIIKDGIIRSSGDTILGGDNKVGVAAIVETLITLSEEKFANNRPIDAVFTVHEESATDGPRLLDYSRLRTSYGYGFDASRALGTMVLASPFYNRFDIQVNGKAAHASRPEEAIPVIPVVVEALHNLKLGKLDEDSVRNIIITQGGDVRNTISGNATLKGETRSFIEGKVEQYTDEVREAFEAAIKNQNLQDITFIFEKVRENGGFKFSDQDPFIQNAARVVTRLGFPPSFINSLGCYDANVFAEKGVKIINFGWGGKFEHTKAEEVSVENLSGLGNLVYGLATDLEPID